MDPVEDIYRREAPAIRASLIRLLGSFERAEEALQLAFVAASAHWPKHGLPRNPRAWLISAGRFRMIDELRREKRFLRAEPELHALYTEQVQDPAMPDEMPDDMLRLIFTCCHPALGADAQVALCLREVCGLTTEAIAALHLAKPAAVAQRIVRTKQTLRRAGIRYEVPEGNDLPPRLDAVLTVLHLVFTEGHMASNGPGTVRSDLSSEAIRLARLVADLIGDADCHGLLALFLFQHARRDARFDANADIVLLDDQDRTLWHREEIAEGMRHLDRALSLPPLSHHTIQAAIAAEHARACHACDTDWDRIVFWYDHLLIAEPGPIVELNRAIALGMRDGPEAGLVLIDPLADGPLRDYRFAHFARADFHWRNGAREKARDIYRGLQSFDLSEAEQRFIGARVASGA